MSTYITQYGSLVDGFYLDAMSTNPSEVAYDATTIAAMLADIDQAVQQNTGYVYVTDQSLNPPAGYLYDQLPSYWDQEVAAIAAIDTPEPGTAAMLALGGLLTFLSVAAKPHGRGTSAR